MAVVRLADIDREALSKQLARLGIQLQLVNPGDEIPGSYWGEEEAGMIADTLYARGDTPLHSIAHEACHMLCMDSSRRRSLHTDAHGDDLEECAVCYLQILMADVLPGMTRQRMFADMDAWGYSFRTGSAQSWFEQDAQDAAAWLEQRGQVLWNTMVDPIILRASAPRWQ